MTSTDILLHPDVLWAQRSDVLYVTIQLNDIKEEKFSLDEKKLTFKGYGGIEGKHYGIELDLLNEVVPQESKQKRTDRGLFFVIKKKDSGPYWPRLTVSKVNFLRVDFNRWVDEDEQDEEEENPFADSSLNAMMQQMGGMGGLGGGEMGGLGGGGGGVGGGKPTLEDMDDSTDSDDQDLPDLES